MLKMYPEITEGATRNYQHVAAIIETNKFKIRTFSPEYSEEKSHALFVLSGRGNLTNLLADGYLTRHYEFKTETTKNAVRVSGTNKVKYQNKPENITIDILL